jgi:DNA-binding NarL/FixJ family response regulator
VRAGLRALLRSEPGILPCSVVDGMVQALEALERVRPDVVIADFHLEDGDGLRLARRVKEAPDPPGVLVYSAYAGPELGLLAAMSGAEAVVSKSATPDELFDAIRRVARGERLIGHPSADDLAHAGNVLDDGDLPILGMLVEGTPLEDVAGVLRLGRSELHARIDHMASRLAPRLHRDPAWS